MGCVHTSHCCEKCGCKYGDPDCPVENGTAEQEFACEECRHEEFAIVMQKVRNLQTGNTYTSPHKAFYGYRAKEKAQEWANQKTTEGDEAHSIMYFVGPEILLEVCDEFNF
jgi:hypothetical protein